MGFKDFFSSKSKKKSLKGGKENKQPLATNDPLKKPLPPVTATGSASSQDSLQVMNSKSTPSSSVSETNLNSSKQTIAQTNSKLRSNSNATSNNSKPRIMSSNDTKRLSSLPTTFLRQSHMSNGQSSGNGIMRNSSTNSRTLSITKSLASATTGSELSTANLPDELIPIVTLIHAQQARSYCEMFVQIPSLEFITNNNLPSSGDNWMIASAKLSGTELSIWEMDSQTAVEKANYESGGFKPVYLNISDANFVYATNARDSQYKLKIQLTNSKVYDLKFATKQDIDFFYSCLLLSQFEYRQLQESFTGALFSSKAIKFSDIRTLLAPENKHIKEEWCILRVPFLNDKWIRCYVVVNPLNSSSKKKKTGKIEIFVSSKKSKKDLLATILSVKSCVSTYPENPDFIDNNALVRLEGDCYVNETLLNQVLLGNIEAATNGNVNGTRSRSSSFGLSKKRSTSSLVSVANNGNTVPLPQQQVSTPPHSRTNSLTRKFGGKQHTRDGSVASVDSSTKMNSRAVITKTHLCYLIPETHSGVKPSETMIRLMIPTMNAFKLYGRPQRFISSRNERDSLLFGLPQLPFTQYLDIDNSFQLVSLNIDNSVKEEWNGLDWIQVFKEMVFFKMSKGWTGSGNLIDTFKDGLLYTKERDMAYDDFDGDGVGFGDENGLVDDDIYNPEDDFIIFSGDDSHNNSPRLQQQGFMTKSDTENSTSNNSSSKNVSVLPALSIPLTRDSYGSKNISPTLKSPLSQQYPAYNNSSSEIDQGQEQDQNPFNTTSTGQDTKASPYSNVDQESDVFVTPEQESSAVFGELETQPQQSQNQPPKSAATAAATAATHKYRSLV